ncbi:MAG: hypothetical protein KTR24_11235 [Saprospiraceae bacterium]|nr:hypothetical protein [Saprospiraceae bacterium]
MEKSPRKSTRSSSAWRHNSSPGSISCIFDLTGFAPWLLLGAFSILQFIDLPAQTPEQLANKVLVVIIPTQHKSIKARTEQVAQEPTNDRLRLDLERRIGEQQRFEEELLSAMSGFAFSEWAYIQDTLLRHRTQKDSLVVCLPDGSAHALHQGTIWYLRKGTAPSGAEGLILCDRDLQALPRPFPGFYKLNRFTSVLENIFGRRGTPWRPLGDIVKKMDQKLARWAQKS